MPSVSGVSNINHVASSANNYAHDLASRLSKQGLEGLKPGEQAIAAWNRSAYKGSSSQPLLKHGHIGVVRRNAQTGKLEQQWSTGTWSRNFPESRIKDCSVYIMGDKSKTQETTDRVISYTHTKGVKHRCYGNVKRALGVKSTIDRLGKGASAYQMNEISNEDLAKMGITRVYAGGSSPVAAAPGLPASQFQMPARDYYPVTPSSDNGQPSNEYIAASNQPNIEGDTSGSDNNSVNSWMDFFGLGDGTNRSNSPNAMAMAANAAVEALNVSQQIDVSSGNGSMSSQDMTNSMNQVDAIQSAYNNYQKNQLNQLA